MITDMDSDSESESNDSGDDSSVGSDNAWHKLHITDKQILVLKLCVVTTFFHVKRKELLPLP
jgi:hypothetical protein